MSTELNMDAERAAAELAACPFCGGAAEIRKTPNMWMVECNNAECGSNPDALAVFKHDVIAAWNRRTAPVSAPIVEELPPEEEISYEVVQDYEGIAWASGKNALQQIMHYAAQYVQDGPVEIVEVRRKVINRLEKA
jgi:hypothetical protein